MVGNSAVALMYLLRSGRALMHYRISAEWAIPILVVLAVANVNCAVALFCWKKWGFWGICVTSVLAIPLSRVVDAGQPLKLSGLVGIFLLYGVLHMGTKNQGWSQLE
jgi:hypothetical protein